jgi:hypothetical protein
MTDMGWIGIIACQNRIFFAFLAGNFQNCLPKSNFFSNFGGK